MLVDFYVVCDEILYCYLDSLDGVLALNDSSRTSPIPNTYAILWVADCSGHILVLCAGK